MNENDVIQLIRNQEEEIPQRNRFWGNYYGLVEDNRDPLKLGRLRIRSSVHFDVTNIPTNMLPWAHYTTQYGGDGTIGFYSVPPVGAMVLIGFIDGDSQYPVCYGAVWGAPDGVSDTYVASINEESPYGIPANPGDWDYTKYNSFTTTTGLRWEMDDNLTLRNVGGGVSGVDFRRIGIEIPGDIELDYGTQSGSFTKGLRVVGQSSGASGIIVDDAASKLILMAPKGTFRDDETITDEEGATAEITGITVKDGFFFRMREDKTQADTDLSSGGGFRGLSEFGTKGQRVVRLDDHEETIRIETPESLSGTGGGHYFEINSKDDFIRTETEYGHVFVMDDQDMLIDLYTPGDDEVEKGYRFLMDEKNRRILLKGDEHKYFFEMNENEGGRFGLFSQYPGRTNAGIEIQDFYFGGKDIVQIYANDGQGQNANGILWDRGSPSGVLRPQAVYLYGGGSGATRNNPKHRIRLVTKSNGASGVVDGQVDIGEVTGRNFTHIDPVVGLHQISAFATLHLRSATKVIIEAGSGNTDVEIKGPWTSRYFNHQHPIPASALLKWQVVDPISGPLAVTQKVGGTTGQADTLGVKVNT